MNFPHDDIPSMGKDIGLGNCLEWLMKLGSIVYASKLLAHTFKPT